MKKHSKLPKSAIAIKPGNSDWLEQAVCPSEDEGRHIYQRLKAIYYLAQQTYQCDNYDDIALPALKFFKEILSPERCIIAIQSPDGVFLSLQSDGVKTKGDYSNWQISQNLLRHVQEQHVAVLSTDAQGDAVLGHFKSVSSLNIRSVLCVPLGSASSPRGIVYLDSRLDTEIFNKHDLYFLTTVCRLLDTAIVSIDRYIEHIRQSEQAKEQIEMLKGELYSQHRIIGHSPALLQSYKKLKKIATSPFPPSILLLGEKGVGKELFARAAHYSSPSAEEPLIMCSLAAFSEQQIESELFGYVKGAYTGAVGSREGLFKRADGGTLFLDEIADIPVSIQIKLLRVLEEKTFSCMGSNKQIHSNFRLVSATSRNIDQMVAEDRFRDDLYDRLAGVIIDIPPLRKRRDDIPILIEYFLQQAGRHIGAEVKISDTAVRFLQNQVWPGNIRQLRNCITAAMAMAESETIGVRDIEQVMRTGGGRATLGDGSSLQNVAELLKEAEKEHMQKALERTGGKANKAAELIGMHKGTFSEKRKRYGI